MLIGFHVGEGCEEGLWWHSAWQQHWHWLYTCTESPQPAPASGSVYSADSSWMQFLLFIINVPIPQTDKQKEDNFLHHILAKKKFRIISKVIRECFKSILLFLLFQLNQDNPDEMRESWHPPLSVILSRRPSLECSSRKVSLYQSGVRNKELGEWWPVAEISGAWVRSNMLGRAEYFLEHEQDLFLNE